MDGKGAGFVIFNGPAYVRAHDSSSYHERRVW